jgi:hypothetical protein
MESDRRDAPEAELVDASDHLLRAIEDLRGIETQKRQEPVSTPEFHELEHEATVRARSIFNLAVEQEDLGKESDGGPSIDEMAADG